MSGRRRSDLGNAVLIVYSDDFFLQIIEPWQAEPQYWKSPGGGIEAGETPEEAAIRECREETGIIVRKEELRKVLEVPLPSSEGGTYLRHVFAAKIDNERICSPAKFGDEGEIPRVVEFKDRCKGMQQNHREFLEAAGLGCQQSVA
jgi:8-oxo-dGTP pyrophosphatase MutT (NUDIX family)